MSLDNSGHYPRIEEILRERTRKVTNHPAGMAQGARMALEAKLTPEDIAYFDTALTIEVEGNNVAVLDSVVQGVGAQVSMITTSSSDKEDGISRFLTIVGQYLYDKLKIQTITVVDEQDKTAIIAPNPFSPVSMAKLNAHISDLQKSVGSPRPKSGGHRE